MTWSAIRWTRPGSVPYSSSPISASPESFSMTRSKTRPLSVLRVHRIGPPGRLVLRPDFEAGEAGDSDVLAGLRRGFLAELLDRLALVLVAVDVRLLEQRDLLAPLRELAFDDPLADVLGLAVLGRLLLEDGALGGLLVGGTSAADTYRGAAAAMCSAMSAAKALKSSLRATKSVSHWISTRAPILPVAWT